MWEISTVDTINNTITINHLYNQDTVFPCTSPITGGTLKVYPTVFTCTDSAEYSLFAFTTSGSIANCLFIGNPAYSDFTGIFVSPNASVTMINCAIIDCGFTALMSKDSYLELINTVTSHNYYGILSDSNGTVIANNVTTTFNSYGMYARRNSYLRADSAIACWNSIGVQSEDNSYMLPYNAYVYHNSTTDYVANRASSMYVGIYVSDATFDPEKNTVGNLNSIIITDLF